MTDGTSAKIEKSLSALLVATRTHCNSFIDEGVFNEDRVRLSVAAKAVKARELIKPIEQGGQGLSKRQAAIALDVPESTLRSHEKKVRENRAEGARKSRMDVEKGITPPRETFETIIIDPPWPMTKIECEVRPNQTDRRTGDVFDYPTMDERELREFAATVKGMAADNCHLFMWTTQKFLPLAMELVKLYGFKYVLEIVWQKPGGFQPTGLPQFNCEFVIYARKGTPQFVSTKGFQCCFSAPRREHSRKRLFL